MAETSRTLTKWSRKVGAAETLATLADLMEDAAVFVVDADRNVLLWSRGAQRLLGFAGDEALDQHCLKSNRCHQCMLGCGIEEHGKVRGVPLKLYSAEGTLITVRKTARAFFDDDGSFAGGIEILVPDEAPEAVAGPEPATPLDATTEFHGLVSRDPAMKACFQIVRNVAETEATALVRGESGSGKELVARAIHSESSRRHGPFVAVNCAALTPTLLESELFGHVKGAFTGAIQERQGLFRQAEGGTLFLDEVAELPLDVQAKLLRILEQRVVVPVGGTEPLPVDVRVIGATHRSLREAVSNGRFREDLMYRLRVVPIFLPPLRDRVGDVELLLWHFIAGYNDRGPRHVRSIAPDAMRALLDHGWPGNVRELKNVVAYAFAVGRGPELLQQELPPELRGEHLPRPALKSALKANASADEARRIREALRSAGGHIGQAAEMLGISRPTLWRKRKKHGIV